MNTEFLIIFVYSYILGSIPFGLIITKIFLKNDIRTIGSGNIGATNVLRTGNKFLAILTLLLDVLKGYFSVCLTLVFFNDFIYFSALVCFLGHIYPVWLKFNGGKGVATYVGVVLALSIELAIIFILTWLLILFLFKYSSLSSIISSMIVFLYSLFTINNNLTLFYFLTFMIILYTHK